MKNGPIEEEEEIEEEIFKIKTKILFVCLFAIDKKKYSHIVLNYLSTSIYFILAFLLSIKRVQQTLELCQTLFLI